MDLNIAEIQFDSGELHYRYSRYLAEDGKKWIRHGLFTAYHKNGQLASEGHYIHGVEHGVWRDFHENGQRAAEGNYENGKEIGESRYWNIDGGQQST
jgi:antitoxin component YwqK of YwqJK toxin-antitoxin module